ncbi:MAG: gamma-glutamylcyclotransferase family protein [Pseudomonadota bacterium]
MRENLFAYGSLSDGQIHFPRISALIETRKEAFVKGSMLRLRCGYPALISPGEESQWIRGEILELKSSDVLWPILDTLMGYDPLKPEKSFFLRTKLNIQGGDGSTQIGQAYFLNPKKIKKGFAPIADGDWMKNLQKTPPVIHQLQPRHRDYIRKLSNCRGRDIVPIKLDLYRELLSMEMIVDKGRRLALTPLGQEVSLFLQ